MGPNLTKKYLFSTHTNLANKILKLSLHDSFSDDQFTECIRIEFTNILFWFPIEKYSNQNKQNLPITQNESFSAKCPRLV